jgi:hypothetical protein
MCGWYTEIWLKTNNGVLERLGYCYRVVWNLAEKQQQCFRTEHCYWFSARFQTTNNPTVLKYCYWFSARFQTTNNPAVLKHNGSFVLLVFMLYDITYYYIDTHEILRFPSEIKIDISLSEIKTIILVFHCPTLNDIYDCDNVGMVM